MKKIKKYIPIFCTIFNSCIEQYICNCISALYEYCTSCINFRWPALKTICNKHWCDGNTNVREEVIERIKCRQKLLDYIWELYNRNYYKGDLSFSDMLNFKHIFCIEEGHTYPLKFYYFEDEVNEILRGNEW